MPFPTERFARSPLFAPPLVPAPVHVAARAEDNGAPAKSRRRRRFSGGGAGYFSPSFLAISLGRACLLTMIEVVL